MNAEIEEAPYLRENRSLLRENEFARPKSNMIQILTLVVGIMSVVALVVVIGVTSATLDEVKAMPTSNVVNVEEDYSLLHVEHSYCTLLRFRLQSHISL
jgi:hypothetical protein